jgi:hypothetical protein
MQIPVRSSQTFANMWTALAVGGTGATALANVFMGLYVVSASNLQLIGSTADQSTPFAGVGSKGPISLTVQGGQSLTQSTTVYGALLIGTQSTTPCQIERTVSGSATQINQGQTAGTTVLRAATFGTAQTSLPATAAIASLAGANGLLYMAVS